MLIILATYFFLVHIIHLELMLFGTKGEIFPQNIAYDKFGIIWHYYEIINKECTSSDTNGSHKSLIIFLSYFQLEHIINPKLMFFVANNGIFLKEGSYDKIYIIWYQILR